MPSVSNSATVSSNASRAIPSSIEPPIGQADENNIGRATDEVAPVDLS
ncbi:MAG: hypothetical protein JWN85_2320 [Gammaproteobacteria bacterium]|nr:hypothetical protein [Gammaproteobacteria bacterium]